MNHINAMIPARDGSVWVGGQGGVARFFRGNWIQNGAEEGWSGGAIGALCEDQRGGIWAVGDKGLERFHPEADSNPPRTLLQPMREKEKNIPEEGVMVVSFGGGDKWQMTAAGRLLYSHRLDEGEWSPFTEATSVTFSDLAPGKHYFQARAMDRAGNVDPDPAHLEFAVVLPWYQESRLVLIASAGTAAAVFFAWLAYKRHRQLVLSYAQVEKQVAERTRELGLANQELLQSQKMRALGTLAAGIAHDFNNILSIIKGSTQIIEDNLDNPAKIRTRADRIKTVVDQGSAVVQAMLGFSRGSDEELEPCEINPVVDNTIQLLGDRFLREVELRFDRGPDLPCLRASQSLIQQILLNFIFNAAESMNGRKRIVITTARPGPLPAGMALPPGAAGAYVSVSVRDFGCGIPPENIARVFEPFFTTKALSTRRGTGLGLSIVYELAKKMEAGLTVESTVGEGTVISLVLPAENGMTANGGDAMKESIILIVEDDDLQFEIYEEALGPHKLARVKNGTEALAQSPAPAAGPAHPGPCVVRGGTGAGFSAGIQGGAAVCPDYHRFRRVGSSPANAGAARAAARPLCPAQAGGHPRIETHGGNRPGRMRPARSRAAIRSPGTLQTSRCPRTVQPLDQPPQPSEPHARNDRRLAARDPTSRCWPGTLAWPAAPSSAICRK